MARDGWCRLSFVFSVLFLPRLCCCCRVYKQPARPSLPSAYLSAHTPTLTEKAQHSHTDERKVYTSFVCVCVSSDGGGGAPTLDAGADRPTICSIYCLWTQFGKGHRAVLTGFV